MEQENFKFGVNLLVSVEKYVGILHCHAHAGKFYVALVVFCSDNCKKKLDVFS